MKYGIRKYIYFTCSLLCLLTLPYIFNQQVTPFTMDECILCYLGILGFLVLGVINS